MGLLASHIWSCAGAGSREVYWADNPDTAAHDFGTRLNIIFLFPTAK
jgi:hypothetical protein